MTGKVTNISKELVERQVYLLFINSRAANLANIVCAGLVLLALQNSRFHLYGVVLTSIVIVFSITRIFLSSQYITYMEEQADQQVIKRFLNAYVVVTLFLGMAWGSFALLQYPLDNSDIRNFVFLINFGLIAGSIAVLSVWIPAFLAFILPQLTGIFFVFFMGSTLYNFYAAIALIFFTGFVIITGHRMNNAKKQELQLELENKQLIIDLNDEIKQRTQIQQQLEIHKRELEVKVAERTDELLSINVDLEKEILERKKIEENLQYIAYHDELTRLPNKALLLDRIQHAIEISKRENLQVAVLFLDLDRFKVTNDSYGHSIGDLLLQEVSQRLQKILRKEDTLARNGGDEFVIVIERVETNKKVIAVAKKIIAMLTEMFEIRSHKIHIGASIGISLYPVDGDTPIDLLRNADTAMYRAKKANGNTFQFYDENMSRQLRDRLELESHLYTALEQGEFYMVFQPQVDCETGMTEGFEALLRWNNAELGQVAPFRFVPLLEETGLIYSVGKWIIKEVVRFISTGAAGSAKVAINLSALQCVNFNLNKYIRRVIDKTGINPRQLEFEITESLLINDFQQTEMFLNELHSIGCTIALDDFGTGYTSMSYLTRLPIDTIKIDRVFVKNIDTNNNLKSIVNAIVTMSKSLNMTNVFEGVETEAELATIKELTGRIIQGYLFSKPLDAEKVAHWLADDNKSHIIGSK